jgi:cAMP-binding proteins - catabolite gene activator and regulatory subunit of cAMP-dependent protein kinases
VATNIRDFSDGRGRNRLIGSLPTDEYRRIKPHLEPVIFKQRQSLFEADADITHVYFPETMVVSLVSGLKSGRTVEVGTTGYEGMAGLPLFLADNSSSVRAFAQIPGLAFRMEANAFVRLSAEGAFHQTMLRYTLAFVTMVAQTAACNGGHLVEQRCARWLLMTHDRVDGDRLPLTHEFLAFMLGIRRAGVTTVMRSFQDYGMIEYTRGQVDIIDRPALERASCECYEVVRAHNERLLPRSA